MKYLILLPLLTVMLVLAGCGEAEPEEPETPPPAPPPKKTTDQIFNEVMGKINPLMRPNEPRGLPLIANLKQAINDYKPPMEPNGPEALGRVKRNMFERIDKAQTAEQWKLVIALAAGLDVFAEGPPPRVGEQQKIERYRTRAMAELSKPVVAVKGFMDDNVFLEVRIPTTNKVYDEQVREGDSFIPDPDNPGENLLRLDDIIGDNRAVRVYYYKTDTAWEVKGPRG